MLDDLLVLKSNISKQLPSCRIVMSKPIIWNYDGKANLTTHNVNKHLSECTENGNNSSQHLGRKGLYLNPKDKGGLVLKFLKQIRKFLRSLKRLNESFLPFDHSDKVNHKVLRKSENLHSVPINEENTYDIRNLRNGNPDRVVIGHININSIRNKFESLVKYVSNNIDILMVSEKKVDDTFPESQFLIEGFFNTL